ncbi:hypothetical protein C1Y40_00938 [Mycobacterium talmoniae]|uniref:Uncharacterized protein n=1 Tax=Mycobacterium talmoniae TaxID=1858794 RepID=A0A2S8BQC7_9MYCO|nr:hypothetical protein C1Y40_00938 [Mycobacterium talmoniae]
MGQVQQHRGGQDTVATNPIQHGLRGRIVQQQQEEFLGNPRHQRKVTGLTFVLREDYSWYGSALTKVTLMVLPLGTV